MSTQAGTGVAKWVVDPTHSVVEFSVKHMMFATVKGRFSKFDATITGDPADWSSAKIEATIDAASIDTRTEDRDKHLRSADFFEVEKYPQIRFVSRKITPKAGQDGEYVLEGDLTIRDVTRPITLDLTYTGQGKDPWGNQRVGFSATGKLNRKDFGLTWNAPLEAGGVLVSEMVTLNLEAQAVKQQ